MSQEVSPKPPISDLDYERYLDRSFDLVARVRAAKEAAQREMETFGHVSEYEIRKIYGQKTELSYEVPQSQELPKESAVVDKQIEPQPAKERAKDRKPEGQSSFEFDHESSADPLDLAEEP